MDMLLDHVKDAYKYMQHAMESFFNENMDHCVWNLEHADARLKMFECDAADFLKYKKSMGMAEESILCLKMCLDGHLTMAQKMFEWAAITCDYEKPPTVKKA